MRLLADLHVHTVLSPCAAPEMTPAAVVREAARKQLSVIAICDHNSAGNAAAAQHAAPAGVHVIAGIELTSREEAHLVGLFPDAPSALAVARAVLETLPELPEVLPRWMGQQQLLTSQGLVRGYETRMLATASGIPLERAVELIHEHAGLAVAAHLDRPSFSIVSQLGMLPAGLALDAVEFSPAGIARGRHQQLASHGLPIITCSDAHSLGEVGAGKIWLDVEEASFDELRMALAGKEGRRCGLA